MPIRSPIQGFENRMKLNLTDSLSCLVRLGRSAGTSREAETLCESDTKICFSRSVIVSPLEAPLIAALIDGASSGTFLSFFLYSRCQKMFVASFG